MKYDKITPGKSPAIPWVVLGESNYVYFLFWPGEKKKNEQDLN